MKNKISLYILILTIFFSVESFSKTIEFISDNIKVLKNGDLINSFNGKAIDKKQSIEIESKISSYDKILEILEVIDEVVFYDNSKDVTIKTDKGIYNRKKNIIYTKGKTFINVENKIEIEGTNFTYNRVDSKIMTDSYSVIRDDKENIYNFENGFIYEVDKEIISAKKTNVIDNLNNKYLFEKVKIDLNTQEIVGKDIYIDFIDQFFGNKENDPALKGRSVVSNNKQTKIQKSVFSTCSLVNKKCRDWELESEIFNHDKEKQIFEYTNSWLKVFDRKFLYFPYFNHPDPSVKRKSGFLMPSWTNSENLGRWVHIPYFKVISEDKDLTYNPRIYLEDKFIFQTEYRQAYKNDGFLISDFSLNHDGENRSAHIFAQLSGKYDENTNYEIQLQDVTNDNYLKLYNLKLTSPIIDDQSLLTSKIDLNREIQDDYDLNISAIVYENLSKGDSDKFQYILPNFNYTKYVPIGENYNGNFKFISNGYQKNFDTNKYELIVNNDFLYESNNYISNLGLANNFDILFKNINSYAENSISYEEKNDHDIFGILKFKTEYPLRKQFESSTNFLKPIISFKYSPNNTRDISTKDVRLNYENIFSLNRIGDSNMVEGGKSLSFGLEYEKQNLNFEKIFGINIANVVKDKKNINLPNKSKLSETRSDIVGEIEFNYFDNLELKYNFSYDRDLDHSNYDSISSNFKVNNFIADFDYLLEHNDLDQKEVGSLETTYLLDNRKSFKFKTRRDFDADFTEYYNLIYTYKTDCLEANLEYNKKFYESGNIVPDKSLFFTIRFIPFAEIRAKDTRLQDY